MTTWSCGIEECARQFDGPARLIRHQAADHADCQCAVCGRTLPAGFLAIKHAFDEHTRAEYVRAYDADSDEIRVRERLIDEVEEQIDVNALRNRIQTEGESAVSAGD